jgi:2'-hydroxyisoflavone reductase
VKGIILKILILGGTGFLGPYLVDELKERGHEVTLFNRGNNPILGVREIIGTREGDLVELKGTTWDAVIDTSCHIPSIAENSSKVLSTKHYTFISSIGVYKNFRVLGITENDELAQLECESEEITEQNYGALKAASEKVIERFFPNATLIIRPGLIVGPKDPTGRFSYWPLRLAEGGEILAPISPEILVQVIDVRDLAKWIVRMVEDKAIGIYNVTGEKMTLGQVFELCFKGPKCSFTWVSESFLIENQVQDWSELPLWLSSKRHSPGLMRIDNDKAIKAGLSLRPISETASAVLEEERKGLSKEKELQLLKQWKKA